jgi:hypothetical protein
LRLPRWLAADLLQFLVQGILSSPQSRQGEAHLSKTSLAQEAAALLALLTGWVLQLLQVEEHAYMAKLLEEDLHMP